MDVVRENARETKKQFFWKNFQNFRNFFFKPISLQNSRKLISRQKPPQSYQDKASTQAT